MAPQTDSSNELIIEPGSFRDRNGRIFYSQDIVYRAINRAALDQWDIVSSTRFFKKALSEGKLVHTEKIDMTTLPDSSSLRDWSGVLKHEVIPFISYPYEWSFGMLKDAALLQLEILMDALTENITMKDATSYNVQWKGSTPKFIDIPSFEILIPGTPWVGYRQFCELFLYPLMLQAYKNTSFHPWLRGRIDGIEPHEINSIMSLRDLLRPGVFADVFLQSKMQSKYADSTRKIKDELRTVGFPKEMILSNLKRLRKIVSDLIWKQSKSEWSDYEEENSYSGEDTQTKVDFVRQIVSNKRRRLAWDLGCNTGRYSKLAAENTDIVIAMDSDHLAVDRLYNELKKESNQRILPLVINLADASPSLGWRGKERKCLVERGKPNLIIALALIHHIVISANIPLRELVDWLASFGADLVIEFVTKDDPMAKILLRNKDDQYRDYELPYFEKCLQDKFAVLQRKELKSGTRFLYFASAQM